MKNGSDHALLRSNEPMNVKEIGNENETVINTEVGLGTPNVTERGDPNETGTEITSLEMEATAVGGGAMEELLVALSKPGIAPWLNAWGYRSGPNWLACPLALFPLYHSFTDT